MPEQKKDDSKAIWAKLAGEFRSIHEKVKNDAVKFGNELPPGIKNGTAQVVDAKIGVYASGMNKGKPYVQIRISVKEPTVFEGTKLQGRQASKMLKVFGDNAEAKAQAYATVLNELKKLGLVINDKTRVEDVPNLLEVLKKTKPHTKFSTRLWTPDPLPGKPPPTPFLQLDLEGKCAYTAPVNGQASQAATEDHSADEENVDESVAEEPAAAAEPEFDETSGDLNALATAADNGDEDASAKITEMATRAGVDPKKIASAKSWASVVEMMSAIGADDGGSDEEATDEDVTEEVVDEDESTADEEPEPYVPQKDDICQLEVKVKDKAGKVSTKKIQVQVKTINAKTQTVTLLDSAKKSVITTKDKAGKVVPRQVPWSELIVGD